MAVRGTQWLNRLMLALCAAVEPTHRHRIIVLCICLRRVVERSLTFGLVSELSLHMHEGDIAFAPIVEQVAECRRKIHQLLSCEDPLI